MSNSNAPVDLSGSPHIGGQKMSSSLKERLKRSSRLHSSPLSKPASPYLPSPTTKLKHSYSSVATDFQIPISFEANENIPEYLKEDIENCHDKVKFQDLYLSLQKHVAKNEERLRKLKLVQQHHNKNKPDYLTSLIQKWLTTAQDALKRLFELLPEPKPPNLQSLVNVLQIDSALIKFNSETDSFL